MEIRLHRNYYIRNHVTTTYGWDLRSAVHYDVTTTHLYLFRRAKSCPKAKEHFRIKIDFTGIDNGSVFFCSNEKASHMAGWANPEIALIAIAENLDHKTTTYESMNYYSQASFIYTRSVINANEIRDEPRKERPKRVRLV